jgi:hypothetical protein
MIDEVTQVRIRVKSTSEVEKERRMHIFCKHSLRLHP